MAIFDLIGSPLAGGAAAWILTYLLHSSLLLAIAWLATSPLGGRRLAAQERIWRLALVGSLVTATLQVGRRGSLETREDRMKPFPFQGSARLEGVPLRANPSHDPSCGKKSLYFPSPGRT